MQFQPATIGKDCHVVLSWCCLLVADDCGWDAAGGFVTGVGWWLCALLQPSLVEQ
jgi:hypothetical protein